MDASQITKLRQIQSTRSIQAVRSYDSSFQTQVRRLQVNHHIQGAAECDGEITSAPTLTSCCNDLYGGNGASTSLSTDSSQRVPNPMYRANGSGTRVYTTESLLLQQASRATGCALPISDSIVQPLLYCNDTNGPTNTIPAENLPINNQSNPYLPPYDTYHFMKYPNERCPICFVGRMTNDQERCQCNTQP